MMRNSQARKLLGPLQAILQQILAALIVRHQRAGVAAQSWDLGLEAALKFAH
jgi:hypothetical protein